MNATTSKKRRRAKTKQENDMEVAIGKAMKHLHFRLLSDSGGIR